MFCGSTTQYSDKFEGKHCTWTIGTTILTLLISYITGKQTAFGIDALEKVNVAKQKKSKSVAAFRRKLIIMKWKDKINALVNTVHNNHMIPMKRRKGRLGNQQL
jgi:hypothetical protein